MISASLPLTEFFRLWNSKLFDIASAEVPLRSLDRSRTFY